MSLHWGISHEPRKFRISLYPFSDTTGAIILLFSCRATQLTFGTDPLAIPAAMKILGGCTHWKGHADAHASAVSLLSLAKHLMDCSRTIASFCLSGSYSSWLTKPSRPRIAPPRNSSTSSIRPIPFRPLSL
jgi:hypothetical protein